MSDRDEMRRLAREGWGAVADAYVEKLWNELDAKPYDRALLDLFASFARPKGTVLDLGCGPGHVSKYLAARGLRMHGIDIAPEMIGLARTRVPEATFAVGDLLDLQLEDETRSGAVLLYSLINLVREDVADVLRDVRRGLVLGSPLVVAVHRGTGSIRSDEVLGRRVTIEGTLFEADEIADYVSDSGFDVITCETRPAYPTEYPTERIYLLARAG
jgi:SAM-dependent methyltransferase